MELGWSALMLLVAGAAVIWFLQESLAVRERANTAAMEACRRLSLQFLDGTVAFTRLSFARENGQVTLRRTYVFDYTANSIERRQGFVILLGRRVESVGYAPGEDQRTPPQPQPVTISISATLTPVSQPPPTPESEPEAVPAPQPVKTAEIFDLADWRARRQPSSTTRRNGNSEHGNGPADGHVDGQDSHP